MCICRNLAQELVASCEAALASLPSALSPRWEQRVSVMLRPPDLPPPCQSRLAKWVSPRSSPVSAAAETARVRCYLYRSNFFSARSPYFIPGSCCWPWLPLSAHSIRHVQALAEHFQVDSA